MINKKPDSCEPTLEWVQEVERAVLWRLGSGIKLDKYMFADETRPILKDEEKTFALLDELWGIFRLYEAARTDNALQEMGFEKVLESARRNCNDLLKALSYKKDQQSYKYDARLSVLGVDNTLFSDSDLAITTFDAHLDWLSNLEVRLEIAAQKQRRLQKSRTGRKDHERFLRQRIKECYEAFWRSPTLEIAPDGEVTLAAGFLTFAKPVFLRFAGGEEEHHKASSLKNAYKRDLQVKRPDTFSGSSEDLGSLREEVRRRRKFLKTNDD